MASRVQTLSPWNGLTVRRFRTTAGAVSLCNRSFGNNDASFPFFFFFFLSGITGNHETPLNYSKTCLCF